MKFPDMAPAEFAALAGEVGDDIEVAAAMESDRVTVHRWKTGKRAVPGPARVLIRILADRAREELEAERREVRRAARAKGEPKLAASR